MRKPIIHEQYFDVGSFKIIVIEGVGFKKYFL